MGRLPRHPEGGVPGRAAVALSAACLVAAAILACAACLTGCEGAVSPGAVGLDAPVLSPKLAAAVNAQVEAKASAEISKALEAHSGDQTAGPHGINIGSVVMDGGTVALIVLAVLALLAAGLAYVWLVSRRRAAALRLVVAESMDRPQDWKDEMRAKALDRSPGVAQQLRRAVKRVKRLRRLRPDAL